MSSSVHDRLIASTRIIDVPREKVWQAFADKQVLEKWWGPTGFTNTIRHFEFRPGGEWHLVMHGPDGADYGNKSVFKEVTKPERIVFKHLEPVHGFLMTIVLEDANGKTDLRWEMLFDDAEECARVRQFVEPANEQNFDRLDAVLRE